MFWTNFEKSCAEKGMTPAQVAKECGINKSNVSLWKNKGYVPRSEAIRSLAEYLEVSVDYLLGNEKNAPTEAGESAIEFDFSNLINADGTPADDEKKQIILRILSMGKEDTGKLMKWIDFMDDLNQTKK